MVALPAETAFTVPFDTDATPVLEEVHVTFLLVAFPGETDAVSVAV